MKEILSQKEVETLCSLYLDGNLNVSEERDLETVLSNSNYKGEIVEETLFVMGIAAGVPRRGTSKKTMHGILYRILCTSAAAVILLFGVSVLWSYLGGHTAFNNSEIVCEVYVDGVKVTDPVKSKQMAIESYNRSMRLLAEIQEREQTKLERAQYLTRRVEEKLANLEINQ